MAGEQFVLGAASTDIAYELEVQLFLRQRGWPVPELVREPFNLDGVTWWLVTRLPGAPPERGVVEQRRRGQLLAKLHATTARLAVPGQRRGFALADSIVDRNLDHALSAYEAVRPVEARILRWHLDWLRAAFAELNLAHAETIVLHGDFAPWNLLFVDGQLSGILDFEASHLNYRVADFALAWRGDQDEVLAGYVEVHPLTELDWDLLVPVFWSWLFMGVADGIAKMLSDPSEVHGFDWQIKHLLRRSGARLQHVSRCPYAP